MKIVKLRIENFKILKGIHELDFDSNLIFLVGENNSGKSTVLESINYLINGAHGCAPSKSNLASLRGNERRGLGQSPILIKLSDSATFSLQNEYQAWVTKLSEEVSAVVLILFNIASIIELISFVSTPFFTAL